MMRNLKPAGMLVPGDRFVHTTAHDEHVVEAAVVNVLSHRVSIRTTEGVWLAFFPDARLVLA